MLEFSIAAKMPALANKKPMPPPRSKRGVSRDPYAERGVEPDLEELLDDPVTQALMDRDGVSNANLRDLISSTRHHIKERQSL